MPSTTKPYIPRADGDFSSFAAQFYAALDVWWKAQGYDGAALEPLKNAVDAWDIRQSQHVAAQAAARSAVEAKFAARAALEQIIRPLAAFVQADAKTTNADRAEIGITVRDRARTDAAVPTSRPRTLVESGQRLTHTLRLVDESTPTRRSKPVGVQRAEVFVALTPPNAPAPADPAAYRYIGSVSRGETTLSFEVENGGLQAHYLARWVAATGAMGPWSETASATVAA